MRAPALLVALALFCPGWGDGGPSGADEPNKPRADEPKKKPALYEPAADARKQVEAAAATAKRSAARVKAFLDRWVAARKDVPKAPDPAQAEVRKLRGHWTMAALEIDGSAVEQPRLRGTTLEIRGDRYIVWTGKKPREVRFTLDSSKAPKEIDLFFPDPPNADQVHRGIYVLDGDTFKVCKAQAAGQPRPTEFRTRPNTGVFLVTWKRQPSD